jgi:hypothetical protein
MIALRYASERSTMTTLDSDFTGRGDLSPLAVTVRRACELSGLGATSIWAFLRDGRLDAVRVAGVRRTLVSYPSLVRLLQPETSPQSGADASAASGCSGVSVAK